MFGTANVEIKKPRNPIRSYGADPVKKEYQGLQRGSPDVFRPAKVLSMILNWPVDGFCHNAVEAFAYVMMFGKSLPAETWSDVL